MIVSRDGSRLDFFFPQKAIKGMPNYAYNIPRPQFDDTGLAITLAPEEVVHERLGHVVEGVGPGGAAPQAYSGFSMTERPR